MQRDVNLARITQIAQCSGTTVVKVNLSCRVVQPNCTLPSSGISRSLKSVCAESWHNHTGCTSVPAHLTSFTISEHVVRQPTLRSIAVFEVCTGCVLIEVLTCLSITNGAQTVLARRLPMWFSCSLMVGSARSFSVRSGYEN